MLREKPSNQYPFLFPLLFLCLLWFVKFYEVITNTELYHYGIYPRTSKGLLGILTGPLLHSGYEHLWANSVSLFVLGCILFYFYKNISIQIFFWIYLTTGIWVWVAARSSYHIGASGIVYGLESFLFFSGVFRKNKSLMALSLLVVFLYGSSVWGILPIQKHISWESHALGALAGLIIAYSFKKEGPSNPDYDLGEDEENETWLTAQQEELNADNDKKQSDIHIHYEYIEKKNITPSDSKNISG